MYAVIRSLRFSLRARLIRMQFVHLHHMNMQVCKITVWLGAQQQLFASNYEVDFVFSVYTSYYRLISFAIKLWLIGQTPPIIIHSFDIWIEFFFLFIQMNGSIHLNLLWNVRIEMESRLQHTIMLFFPLLTKMRHWAAIVLTRSTILIGRSNDHWS